MSPQLAHPLSPLHHNLLQARKAPVARDLQSTSTVTSSASPSSSSTSSPQPSNSPSPLPSSNQSPTTWQLDHQNNTPITPPTSPYSQSVRTLPRCGVVNFRKDGDNLRWAPRVTHNSSGVAARVHNFEDAFSLEEFSSRALPVVWRSTGGNPRLSDLTRSHSNHSPASIRSPRSVSSHSDHPPPPPPPKRSLQPMEKRAKSMGSQRVLVRNPSVKRAVALATEVHRPSVWSILAHTTKYQRSRAKARIQNEANKHTDDSHKRTEFTPIPGPRRNASKKDVPTTTADSIAHRQPWATLSRHKAQRGDRRGKATRRAPETCGKKTSSLLQRLLSHLDRRNGKKSSFEDTTRSHPGERNRMGFSRSDGSSGSDSDDKSTVGEKSKGLFRQPRHSEGHSSRRVVSALGGNLGPLKGSQRRDFARVSSQDDQYVTFMTSES